MFVLFPVSLAYVVTHTARAEVPRADLGAAYENVEFTTSDGLRLKGWYIPSKNRAAVIAFPGRSGPQKQARMLARHGYGVLLFDRRGEGASEGDPNVFGWGGERDLHAAAAYLRSRADVDGSRIGGIGLSVGGEMLIHAAAHSDAFNGDRLRGSERTVDARRARESATGGTTPRPPTQASLTAAVAVFNERAASAEPEERGRQDRADAACSSFTASMAREARRPGRTRRSTRPRASTKQIWEVPNGQHIAGITTQTAEYERRVVAFFDSALLDAK